jgi:hypothetical protein
MLAIVVSVSALVVIGAAAMYALPNFNIALPNFNNFAELFPHEAASAPIPDPAVSATLKDIQSAQQQNAVALQENGAVLQQDAATLQQGAATLDAAGSGDAVKPPPDRFDLLARGVLPKERAETRRLRRALPPLALAAARAAPQAFRAIRYRRIG